MAPIGKLYGYSRQPQTIAIRSAAAIAGFELEFPPFEFGVSNKEPEFVKKFPHGKIPAFEDSEGFTLSEGAVIARYVSSLAPDSGLLGRNAKETARVDQWVHFAESEIIMITMLIYYALNMNGVPGYNAQLHESYVKDTTRSIQFLEDYLAKRPSGFVVNDSITLADIFVANAAMCAGLTVCGAAEREKTYPHVFAHYAKVTSDERIKALFEKSEFVEKPLAVQAE